MTRGDAIDMLRQICSYLTAGNPVWRTEPIREACEKAIEALTEKEPSAESQKGEWIETKIWGGRNYSCSCCRFEFNVDTVMLQPIWHYCPNCGAKMIADKDDTQ